MVTPFLREPTSRQRTEIIKTIFFREFTDPSDFKNTTGPRKSTCLGDYRQEWMFTNACFYPQFINSGSTTVQAQRRPTRRLVCGLFGAMSKIKRLLHTNWAEEIIASMFTFFWGGVEFYKCGWFKKKKDHLIFIRMHSSVFFVNGYWDHSVRNRFYFYFSGVRVLME